MRMSWLFTAVTNLDEPCPSAASDFSVFVSWVLHAGEGANTVLAGVMRGCGRQQLGAAVSLVTYWALGLPFACLLAFKLQMGALGLWVGLTGTAGLQALLNCFIICRCGAWNS